MYLEQMIKENPGINLTVNAGYFGEADPPDSELKLVVCSYQLG